MTPLQNPSTLGPVPAHGSAKLSSFVALFVGLVLLQLFVREAKGGDFNSVVLSEVAAMPKGGRYAASRLATLRLQQAAHLEAGKFCLVPDAAAPSYCSGATYLVFLKTIDALQTGGQIRLDPSVLNALLIHGQPDGMGIWGRWNANGPGTARLFHELRLGRNFDNFSEAKPGDFMKIFWSAEVGKLEHGHSVVYLGTEAVGGVQQVRFWSSNVPGGYGEKSVPRSKIAYAIFSRLETPEALTQFANMPEKDPYLGSLNTTRSSISEARRMSGVTGI